MRFLSLLLLSLIIVSPARAADTVKIGELFCYTACSDTAKFWRNGWTMALNEVNAAGGVLGKPLEVISRDSKGSPPDALQALNEFTDRENIEVIFGTLYDHVSLATVGFAKQKQVLFMKGFGGSNNLSGKEGHDLYFQIEPPISAWIGPLADKAAASGKKRWAFLAADYEFGRALVDQFKKDLNARVPDVEFVETQWFPIGKLNAGPTVQALSRTKPDGIFNLVFEGDYARFLREGRKRELFKGRMIINPVAAHPGFIRQLGDEAPKGWLSASGYPAKQFKDEAHKAFVKKYEVLHQETPSLGAYYGYITLKILAEAINDAQSTAPKDVANALTSVTFETPDQKVTFRALDGLSNRGVYIGETGFYGGLPTMVNWQYIDSAPYLPSEEDVKAVRSK